MSDIPKKIPRRDKKAFLSEQCKEIEENNKMGNTRGFFKRMGDTKETCHAKERQWSHSVMSDSLQPHGLQPTSLLCPWNFPGKSTGVRCHFLLQRIFPTQGSNLGLPHCRQTLYHLSHQGSSIIHKLGREVPNEMMVTFYCVWLLILHFLSSYFLY